MSARIAGFLFLAASLLPAAARGQSCFGVPLGDGQVAVGIGLDWEPGFDGAEVAAQLPIPLGIGASLSDETTFAERVTVRRYGIRLSSDVFERGAARLCPFVGFQYHDYPGDIRRRIEVPVGIAGSVRIGKYEERGWGGYGSLARERQDYQSDSSPVPPVHWTLVGEIGLFGWYGPIYGSVGRGTYSDSFPIRLGVRF